MLLNLKEAPVIRTVDPFTGADLCKHRVAGHRGGGPKLYTLHPFTAPVRWLLFHFAGISRVSGSSVLAEFQRLLPAPDLWSMLHCTGNFPVNPAPATPEPFTLRAATCIAVKHLLPRDRKPAPELALSEHGT
ncbi:MAG: hypothetical protein H2205_04585 [Citrobacter pasteurii]|uniref:hypothetical protein n=1 Tax=Citrobacter pasteurii TaxID=1563222 RepID=UPI0017AF9994|nr:hypothetical protein [Citrobacter pasteurii]MBA4711754.1 hypothetical protein [Citrobacter pasteurii]